MEFMRKLLADQTGTSAVEYGMICGLMVIGIIAGVQGLGASVTDSLNTTSTKVKNAGQP
jgi:pilus assembly protein Flp/PilA